MDSQRFRELVEGDVREHELIPPGGVVTCFVSGGADSTALWHVLRQLGYDVSAITVDHGLRGRESDEDAAFCRDVLGAEVVDGSCGGKTEDQLRELRYSFATDRLRATGHTVSDQVETVLYRLVSSGMPGWIKWHREDGVVRPLLGRTREETEAYCHAEGLDFRKDSSNADTKRGLIREQILPLLRQLHPAAEENLLRLTREPSPLADLLAAPVGSKRLDLGGGLTAVREYDNVWLEQTPVALDGEVRWGPWRISARERGLKVRGWRAGDRLAGRTRKIQDVFVDAKIPRSERESWPLVVRGDEVVAVPGIVEAEGVSAERDAD